MVVVKGCKGVRADPGMMPLIDEAKITTGAWGLEGLGFRGQELGIRGLGFRSPAGRNQGLSLVRGRVGGVVHGLELGIRV